MEKKPLNILSLIHVLFRHSLCTVEHLSGLYLGFSALGEKILQVVVGGVNRHRPQSCPFKGFL